MLLQALEDQLEKLRDEAARAKRQRNAVRDASKARHGPELLAVHRSKLRQHRPGREQIIDEVCIHGSSVWPCTFLLYSAVSLQQYASQLCGSIAHGCRLL